MEVSKRTLKASEGWVKYKINHLEKEDISFIQVMDSLEAEEEEEEEEEEKVEKPYEQVVVE